MSDFLAVPQSSRRTIGLLIALFATGGYGGMNLHESDMEHMRERIGDIRNEDRNRFEDLLLHCKPDTAETQSHEHP